jgi:MFS transporter, DHA1 family, multidrug resistance protein
MDMAQRPEPETSAATPPRPVVWRDRTTPPHISTLILLAGISAMSMNIFLPSLPGIAQWFQADYALVQLSVSGYLGITAIAQLVAGPLSDRYGRRPVIIGGILMFLAATIGCILAPTIESFLFFRMFQASIATGFVLSRAIVRDMVEPDAAASMIGYVTMGMALVPMVSPMIGGVLDTLFDWRATFVAMFLAGLFLLWLVLSDLGETNRTRSVSMAAQFRTYPELFRSQRFWGYAMTAAFTSGAFFTVLGGAPYVASTLMQLEPAELGFYFGFIAFGYMSGNYLSGRFARRLGLNRMMLLGTIVSLCAVGLGCILHAAGFLHPIALFGPVLLVGVGNGLTLPSANAGIVSVRPHLAGSASGLGGTLMVGGGAALSATTGFLLEGGSTAWPLLGMMFLSACGAIAMTLWVIRVARRKGDVHPHPG